MTGSGRSEVAKDRRYWVVSPNVKNNGRTVSDWRQASVRERAAFMGWLPDDYAHGQMGPKFAGKKAQGIKSGDVILIARRHKGEPEIVGFGVVVGNATENTRAKTPADFGSLRKLSPFIPWSRQPSGVPVIDVLQHTKALVQLHPEGGGAHKKVCTWMEKQLANGSDSANGSSSKKTSARKTQNPADPDTSVIDLPESHQLDYKVQTRSQVIRAKKEEAALVLAYADWLMRQGRTLNAAKYSNLQCDGYERARDNLVEAKAKTSREHIRMAVGQLLDYAFQGSEKLGALNKAILLPDKPEDGIAEWLQSLEIYLVWREGSVFLDNANGQFT